VPTGHATSAEQWLAFREPPAPEGRVMSPTHDPHLEAASTLAVIAVSNEPLLFMTGDLKIIAASATFCSIFDIDPASVPGRRLSEIGNGEWNIPRLTSLLNATAVSSVLIDGYELDLVRRGKPTRQLVLIARRLDDGD
jgi:hypothetical protein